MALRAKNRRVAKMLLDKTPSLTREEAGQCALLHADPLSAAIFCNAKRCAARLLQEPAVTVTDAVRRAPAITPENETQKFVVQHLDMPLEELLQPGDFGPELDHSAFLPVLRRYGQLPHQRLEQIIKQTQQCGGPDTGLRTGGTAARTAAGRWSAGPGRGKRSSQRLSGPAPVSAKPDPALHPKGG